MKSANEDNKMETWYADLAYDPRMRVQIRSRMRDRTHRKQSENTKNTSTVPEPIGTIKSQQSGTRAQH